MNVLAIKTRIFKLKEDLLDFVIEHVETLNEGDVLIITSKIAALAQGRVSDSEDKRKVAEEDSDLAIEGNYTLLTIKDGSVMTSAGIDRSNSETGQLILLPEDSFKVAEDVRAALKDKFNIKDLGVVITDSRTHAFRTGASGVAIGYAGFKGIKDYEGQKDLFDYTLTYSKVNIADAVATAAVLCMGEGTETQPLAVVSDAPVNFTDKIDQDELKVDLHDDVYSELMKYLYKDS